MCAGSKCVCSVMIAACANVPLFLVSILLFWNPEYISIMIRDLSCIFTWHVVLSDFIIIIY